MIPPKFALWFAWALALFLLWRDTRQRRDLPLSLWLPTLWLMRCGSRTIDYWFSGDDLGRLDPIFIFLLMIAGFFVLARRRCDWGGIFAHNAAVFVFYGYLVASLFWVDDLESPLIKVFRPLGDLEMALIVATEAKPREAIVTMFRRCAFLLIPLSIVLIRYFPELGKMQDKHWGSDIWCGVTTHKNPLGQLCIVAVLAFFWQLLEARREGKRLWRQYIPWLYLAMTYYLLNGGGNSNSRSSTAILCLMVAVVMYLVLGRWRERPEMVLRIIVTGAVCLAVIAFVLELFGTSLQAVVAESQGKDATLSDRTYLWRDVIRLGMENPVLGAGYGGFWVPSIYGKLSPMVDNRPAEAHSGYLETFANLGFVGVGLLLWVILQSLRSAAKTMHSNFEYGRLRLLLILMVAIMNYAEATFPRGNHLWWFGFLIVAVYASPWVNQPGPAHTELVEHHETIELEEESVPT